MTVRRQCRLGENVLRPEAGFMAVAERNAEDAGRGLRNPEQPQIGIEIGRVLQALLRLKVDARRILAALTQPQRMQRSPSSIRKHRNFTIPISCWA